MANRLVCTGVVHKPTLALRAREQLYAETTVLLGDPTLPDSVKRGGTFNEEDMVTIQKMKDALATIPGVKFNYIDNHPSLINTLLSKRPKFVLNLCDEGFDNIATQELHVPALLEMLGIPYTGAGPQCLGMCYNKSLVAALAESLDIPVPLETYFDPDDQAANLPSVFPALVKPNFGDNSIGITQNAVVRDSTELLEYLNKLWESMPNTPVLIQEFLSGPEYSIGIIGNPGLSMDYLPPLEVDYYGLDPKLPKILGYESKWDPNSPYWTQIKYKEAEIDEETRRKLYDYSSILFERLGCRDYARFDFRADAEGEVKLLEVNPNPGWCWDGKFNIMCGFAGMGYSEMLLRVLDAAEERIKNPICDPQLSNGNTNGNGGGLIFNGKAA
ncbi:MAG: D-alanine--D-alanine ligase [SAR324 cluster bacterium]|uniref:D-alanine--D-alanine ligase n=1 Tax=SAR324 cluster bacterium TaxID=2024889 RepID=A0A7X9FTH0_9DELT|nr:D-alanine--D-alanine ligase [SAR324 cluster bacterium]